MTRVIPAPTPWGDVLAAMDTTDPFRRAFWSGALLALCAWRERNDATGPCRLLVSEAARRKDATGLLASTDAGCLARMRTLCRENLEEDCVTMCDHGEPMLDDCLCREDG